VIGFHLQDCNNSKLLFNKSDNVFFSNGKIGYIFNKGNIIEINEKKYKINFENKEFLVPFHLVFKIKDSKYQNCFFFWYFIYFFF
jgi:hypothetical protein